MRKHNPWTPEELAILRKYYPKGSRLAASHLPRRTHNSVCLMAQRLSLESECNKPPQENSGKPFTNLELEYLCENYALLGPAPIAKALSRTRAAVQTKAMKMGLVFIRSPEEDEWATTMPTHKITKKWKSTQPPGPRWVFDLAKQIDPQTELDLA